MNHPLQEPFGLSDWNLLERKLPANWCPYETWAPVLDPQFKDAWLNCVFGSICTRKLYINDSVYGTPTNIYCKIAMVYQQYSSPLWFMNTIGYSVFIGNTVQTITLDCDSYGVNAIYSLGPQPEIIVATVKFKNTCTHGSLNQLLTNPFFGYLAFNCAPCQLTGVTRSASNPVASGGTITYTLGQTASSTTVTYVQAPTTCNIFLITTHSITITSGGSKLWLKSLTTSGNLTSDGKVIQITISGLLTDVSYSGTYVLTLVTSTTQRTFTYSDTYVLNVVIINPDPCATPTWVANTITSITTSVLQSPVVSSTFTASSVTLTTCGTITYIMSPITNSFITFDATLRQITVNPTSSANIGTYPMQIVASLTSYPTAATQTLTFNVVVNACVVTSLTVLTNAFNSALTTPVSIGDLTGILIPIATFTQIPACGFVLSISFVADTVPASTATVQPWLTQLDASTMVVKSNDILLSAQTFQIQQITQIGSLTNSQTTQVVFQSCLQALWSPNSVQNMQTTVLASPSLPSQTFLSSSVIFALPCGTVSYTLDTVLPFVNLDPVLQTITVISSNVAEIGFYTLNLVAQLDSYTTNTQAMQFTVTVGACISTTSVTNSLGCVTNCMTACLDSGQSSQAASDQTSNSVSDQSPWFIKRAPYFGKKLATQQVSQCPDSQANPWVFVLPKPVDPNLRGVNVSVSLDLSFFKYQNLTITQKIIAYEPVQKLVNITLSNELNLTRTYQMLVQFFCNKTVQNETETFEQQYKTESIPLNEELEKVARQTVWPKAYIQQIEPNGLMHVKFYQQMNIPKEPKLIKQGNITFNKTDYPNLKIEVLPGLQSNPQMLGFDWKLVNFTDFRMLIQLDFYNRTFVSSHDKNRDFIRLTIYGFNLFEDTNSNLMLPNQTLKAKQLPQLESQSNYQEAVQVSQIAEIAITTVMVSNFILQLLLLGALQSFLDSVKQLQIIVHVMLIDVRYPATAIVFFGMLMKVLTFQFFDLSDSLDRLMSLNSDSEGSQPINDQFSLMGYSQLYITKNFGTLCLTIFYAPILYILSLIGAALFKTRLAYYKLKFHRLMFFDYWVNLLNESYLFLAVCAGLNIHNLKFSSYGEDINSILAVALAILITAYPIFIAVFYNYKNNYSRIINANVEFFGRFGSLIQGFNFLEKGRLPLLYLCSNLTRKLWLAYIVVFQIEMRVFNIFQVNFQALAMMIVTGYTNPMTHSTSNKMELLNETFILIFTYHLYQFTDYNADQDNRNIVGTSLMAVSICNISLNMGIIMIQNFTILAQKLRISYLKMRLKKRIASQLKYRKTLSSQKLEKVVKTISLGQVQRNYLVQFKQRQQTEKVEASLEPAFVQFNRIEATIQNAQMIPTQLTENSQNYPEPIQNQKIYKLQRSLQSLEQLISGDDDYQNELQCMSAVQKPSSGNNQVNQVQQQQDKSLQTRTQLTSNISDSGQKIQVQKVQKDFVIQKLDYLVAEVEMSNQSDEKCNNERLIRLDDDTCIKNALQQVYQDNIESSQSKKSDYASFFKSSFQVAGQHIFKSNSRNSKSLDENFSLAPYPQIGKESQSKSRRTQITPISTEYIDNSNDNVISRVHRRRRQVLADQGDQQKKIPHDQVQVDDQYAYKNLVEEFNSYQQSFSLRIEQRSIVKGSNQTKTQLDQNRRVKTVTQSPLNSSKDFSRSEIPNRFRNMLKSNSTGKQIKPVEKYKNDDSVAQETPSSSKHSFMENNFAQRQKNLQERLSLFKDNKVKSFRVQRKTSKH